jgi:type III secretion protein C
MRRTSCSRTSGLGAAMCSSSRVFASGWRRLAWILLLPGIALLSHSAGAAEIHWRTDNFNYVAQDKPLQEFVREFAAAQGLNVVVAPEVDGTINGKFNLTPQSMLDVLAMSFGLTWYYDGSVLYIYPAGDMSSEVLPLAGISADQFQSALKRLGILDRRYPIAFDREHGTARVAGPKRYVELVKQTLGALDQNSEWMPDPSGTRADIRVFPLRYAWAADFTYTADGQDHTLPGVVSVLQQLYAPTQQTINKSPHQSKLERMRGLGYFRDDQVAGLQPQQLAPLAPRPDPAAAAVGSSLPPVDSGGKLPQFQADGRMNAVIVRDIPERMAFYDAVIRALDVKPGLVEIEARILEVSSDSVGSLGIDWRAQSGSASAQFSSMPPASANGTSSTSSSSSVLPAVPGLTLPSIIPSSQLPQGGTLITVLTDSGRYLMARVNALAEDGKANILSSPRVLTLDNVEAVLENLSTFFVPVAGNLDVGLYNVSAGTSLRVTPLIVTEGGHTQIKLAVRIEDGGITAQSVGQIPVVQRTTITTQAFIKEGDSLLIGGYNTDVHNDTEVGVPGLSSIPVLGMLFKFHQKATSHVEHLFMLTPHVVQP